MRFYNNKRVRSSNWEEEDKRLLIQLIIQRIDVLENKDTSTNTNNIKRAAWREVLSCFNSLSKKKRDLPQIITQWRNTKNNVKSRDREYKRAKLMTGEGTPPPSPPAEDLAIIQAIRNECVIDSDSQYITSFSQSQSSGSPETDSNVPRIPVPLFSSLLNNETEIVKIIEDVEPESKPLFATPVSADKSMDNLRKRIKSERLKYKKITNVDYEQELFLITRRSKKRETERAEEIHNKRMAILDLENEYWKKKLIITKISKEKEIEREEEIHNKRKAILDLEYEFWQTKLNST